MTEIDYTIMVINEIKGYKSKFDFLSTQYKNILLKQGTCPLCFSHIDNRRADYIINQYK